MNQRGENKTDRHGNEFYNADTTLFLSVYGLDYDAVLVDTPDYADSLAVYEKDFLRKMGDHSTKRVSHNVWQSEGRIDHNIPDNPPAERAIRLLFP